MFGNQHDQHKQDDNQIPAQAIDAVVNGDGSDQHNDGQAWQHPGPPPTNDDTTQAPSAPVAPTSHPTDNSVDNDGTANELIDIKQQALTQLSPLVGHLNQTPEEKFRTTMMMIQASDDQTLIRDAYTAAKAIEDEKTRAQALLDIINEINYFTQHQSQA